MNLQRRNGVVFDPRTTREVDASRNMVNRKPYRGPELKAEARLNAKKIDGAWTSPTKTQIHAR